MAETGFGSLSYDPLPTYNDWGFGSPTPVVLGDERPVEGNVEYSTPDLQSILTEADYVDRTINLERDTGFGSPFDNFRYPVQLRGEFDLIPDDGGVVLKLVSLWTAVWDFDQFPKYVKGEGFLGPFRVEYISQANGQVYRAEGDQGSNCFTNYAMDTLYAGVPPLPRGDYDMVIRWQQVNTIIISDAFTVGVRPRIPEAYHIRKHVPSHMKRGPHIITNDTIGVYTQESNLSLIFKTLGEAIQELSGRPTTGLAADFSWQDASMTVETTIGFPDSGVVMIGGHKVSYGSKTTTTFNNLSYTSYWPGSFSLKEEVACDVTAIK